MRNEHKRLEVKAGQGRHKRLFSDQRRRLSRIAMLVVGAVMVATLAPAVTSSVSATTPAPTLPTCQPSMPGGPVFITADCVDPVLNQPYVDIEQPGTMTDPTTGVTVNFTYVHGGFTGTTTKFSVLLSVGKSVRGAILRDHLPDTRSGKRGNGLSIGGNLGLLCRVRHLEWRLCRLE